MAHRPTTRRPPSAARRAMLALALSLCATAAMPHTASAADDDEPDHFDARIQGYTPTVEAKSSGVGLVWVVVVMLGAGCVGVMFMNPKRSHLD